jgi:hypothetical protein
MSAASAAWLGCVEFGKNEHVYVFARTPGPFSAGCVVNAKLVDDDGEYAVPSLALAAGGRRFSVGVAATIGRLTLPTCPWNWPRDDTNRHWSSSESWSIGDGTVGVRWSGTRYTLDGNIDVARYGEVSWRAETPDTFARTGDITNTRLTPGVRLSIPDGSICWRGLASFVLTVREQRRFDTPDTWTSKTDLSERALELAGGLTYVHGSDLSVSTGVRARAYGNVTGTGVVVCLPVGLEWFWGPAAVRLGVDASYGAFRTEDWAYSGFARRVYMGLGLRPTKRLRLDFAPDMDDAADLRDWQLAGSYEF